eukprot:6190894-Pleurochrysis_carterae.AAC.1
MDTTLGSAVAHAHARESHDLAGYADTGDTKASAHDPVRYTHAHVYLSDTHHPSPTPAYVPLGQSKFTPFTSVPLVSRSPAVGISPTVILTVRCQGKVTYPEYATYATVLKTPTLASDAHTPLQCAQSTRCLLAREPARVIASLF